jgi:hypothetical protein
MPTPTGRWADPAFQRLYTTVVSNLVQSMCAPFWWSVTRPGDGQARILQTARSVTSIPVSELGITGNHVYQQYLMDLEAHGHEAIECQFGSSTIYSGKHAIAQSGKWHMATEIPEGVGNAADRSIKTQHRPLIWPPTRAQKSDVVIYGGFPGVLREEKGSTAELPFQWVGAHVNEVN